MLLVSINQVLKDHESQHASLAAVVKSPTLDSMDGWATPDSSDNDTYIEDKADPYSRCSLILHASVTCVHTRACVRVCVRLRACVFCMCIVSISPIESSHCRDAAQFS